MPPVALAILKGMSTPTVVASRAQMAGDYSESSSSSLSSSVSSESSEIWTDALPSPPCDKAPVSSPFCREQRRPSAASDLSNSSSSSTLAFLSSGAAQLLEQLEREGRQIAHMSSSRTLQASAALSAVPVTQASPIAGPSRVRKPRAVMRPPRLGRQPNRQSIYWDDSLSFASTDFSLLPIEDLMADYDDMMCDLNEADWRAREVEAARRDRKGKRVANPSSPRSSARSPAAPASPLSNRTNRNSRHAELPYANMFANENKSATSIFPTRKPAQATTPKSQSGPFPLRKKSVGSLRGEHSDALAASRRVPMPPLPARAAEIAASANTTPRPTMSSTWSTQTLFITNQQQVSPRQASAPVMSRGGSNSSGESSSNAWSPSARSSGASYRGSDGASWRWSVTSGSTAPTSSGDDREYQASILRKGSAASAFSYTSPRSSIVRRSIDEVDVANDERTPRIVQQPHRNSEDLVDWESFLEKEMPTSTPQVELILPHQSALRSTAMARDATSSSTSSGASTPSMSTSTAQPSPVIEQSGGTFPRLRKMKSAKNTLRTRKSFVSVVGSAPGLLRTKSTGSNSSGKTAQRDAVPPVPSRVPFA